MHGFDRRHDASNEIKEAPFFGNAAQHPSVAMAGKYMLEDGVLAVRDRADLNDVAHALRAVVAGKFAEGSFYLFDVGKHVAFDYHLGIRRHQEIFTQSLRWRESQRRSHDGAT